MEGHSFSPEPQFLVFSFNLPVFPFQFQVFWPILTFVFVVQIFCVCFILVYTVNLANTYFFFYLFFFFLRAMRHGQCTVCRYPYVTFFHSMLPSSSLCLNCLSLEPLIVY